MKIHFFYKLLFNLFILLSFVCLYIGIFAPLMTLEKFVFWENQVSLYSALLDLIAQGEWGLFWVIFIFSIIFPLLKSFFLFFVVNGKSHPRPFQQKLLKALAVLGKWSMLDVFVVALLLVTVKLDVIADVKIHYGIYFFGGSVFLTMMMTHWLNWLEHRHPP